MALTKVSRGLLSTGIVDNSNATAITIDSSENVTFAGNILHAGSLTLDVAGSIIFDADGADYFFKNGGTEVLRISGDATPANVTMRVMPSDGDFIIKGNDGGSAITALSLDMSAAGAATFNSTITSPFLSISNATADRTALVSSFRAGADNDNNRANIFIGQNGNSRGMLVRAGRQDGDRSIAQFILNGSGNTIGSNIINFLECYQLSSGAYETTFNQDGENVNFRVESDTNANMLHVDGALNAVGIGITGQSTVGLYVDVPADHHAAVFRNDTALFAPIISDNQAGSGTRHFISFRIDNSVKGNITSTGSVVVYGGQSDYRLKENIVNLTGATNRLKQLKPKRFNFIGDTETIDGFLAHEVGAVVPVAVVGEKDAVDKNGDVDAQQMDNGHLVPLLVATIQELEARLTALENN